MWILSTLNYHLIHGWNYFCILFGEKSDTNGKSTAYFNSSNWINRIALHSHFKFIWKSDILKCKWMCKNRENFLIINASSFQFNLRLLTAHFKRILTTTKKNLHLKNSKLQIRCHFHLNSKNGVSMEIVRIWVMFANKIDGDIRKDAAIGCNA